jgi:type IV pilus assembly protein PilW
MQGFTLVELMISVVIGLVTTLVIAEVLMFSEGQKRTTTAGSDAQINGAQAIYTIQRDLQMAGYGFTASPGLLGCPIHAKYKGTDVATGAATTRFPTIMAPVVIDYSDSNRNSITVLSSAKLSSAIPIQVAAPGYAKGANAFPVISSLGVRAGDIMIAAKGDASICEVFQVSSDPALDSQVDRVDDADWNDNSFPTKTYGFGDMLINLGSVESHTFSISNTSNNKNSLQLTKFVLSSPDTTPSPSDLYPDIVILQALYGKDTNGDGIVDTYDQTTPDSVTKWQQLRSIRLAVVARSAQYEKEIVTPNILYWDVGSSATLNIAPAATACGTSSKCISLHIDNTGGIDWQHYRYKVFDTVVPIMNLLWSS